VDVNKTDSVQVLFVNTDNSFGE